MMTDTNRDLVARLTDLLRRERFALADFIVELADFDRRGIWREIGYASLFDFLHRELGLSRGTAFYRKTAADLVQRYPEIVEPLRDGRLCITAVVEMARVITPDNRAEVLPRFFHRSRQEAKTISAEMAPRVDPPRRTIVTTSQPAVRSLELGQAVQRLNSPNVSASERGVPALQLVSDDRLVPPPSPPRDTNQPLSADLSRLHITVSRRFLEKLEAARVALSHSHPGATTETILEAALDLVLAKDAKKKGFVSKPRPAPVTAPPPGKRYVPAAVRREVWKRDGGRCQYPLESGGVCGSTVRVEIDHIQPVALGGQSTVANTRLACDVHNEVAARRLFGNALMDRFTRHTLPSMPNHALSGPCVRRTEPSCVNRTARPDSAIPVTAQRESSP